MSSYIILSITNMKKIISSIIWLSLLSINYVNAAIDTWLVKIDPKIKWTDDSVDIAAQKLITNFIIFLSIIAVIYALYWWFLILTAWWKEDNVKKWRTIIVQALIGLVVIWLANSIITWLINAILKTT